MSWYADTDFDRYDAAAHDDATRAADLDDLQVAYADARAALATIRDDGSMDRTQRWMILDRFAQVVQQLEVEKTRASYGAISAAIVADCLRGAL